jgi:prepilin-type processing-associated H-X9-DG protein
VSAGPFRCPSDQRADLVNQPNRTYGLNTGLTSIQQPNSAPIPSTTSGLAWWNWNTPSPQKGGAARVTEVLDPSRMILLTELAGFATGSVRHTILFQTDRAYVQRGVGPTSPHVGGANVLFCDGSVRAAAFPSTGKLVVSGPNWYEQNYQMPSLAEVDVALPTSMWTLRRD